jgi:hypothetical protein
MQNLRFVCLLQQRVVLMEMFMWTLFCQKAVYQNYNEDVATSFVQSHISIIQS